MYKQTCSTSMDVIISHQPTWFVGTIKPAQGAMLLISQSGLSLQVGTLRTMSISK